MNAPASLPDLAPITRRRKPDRGARGRAAPKRVLTTVELQSFDPVACEMVTQTAQAYTRALPPAMTALPEPLRKAALAYAKAIEDVEAGGASDPAAVGASGAGGATHEGRQYHALRQVEHLRRLEAAIGPGVVYLGRRRGAASGVVVSRKAILRAVAVDGSTLEGCLISQRLGVNSPRKKLILSAFLSAVEAVAINLGLIEEIKNIPKAKKTS